MSRKKVVIAAALVGAAVLLVVGHPPWSGPELFAVWGPHGVNVGDVVVVCVAAGAALAVLKGWDT